MPIRYAVDFLRIATFLTLYGIFVSQEVKNPIRLPVRQKRRGCRVAYEYRPFDSSTNFTRVQSYKLMVLTFLLSRALVLHVKIWMYRDILCMHGEGVDPGTFLWNGCSIIAGRGPFRRRSIVIIHPSTSPQLHPPVSSTTIHGNERVDMSLSTVGIAIGCTPSRCA